MKFSHPYFLRDLLTHSHNNCSSSRKKGKMMSSASCGLPWETTHRFQPVLRIRAAKRGSRTREGMHHQGSNAVLGALEVQPTYLQSLGGGTQTTVRHSAGTIRTPHSSGRLCFLIPAYFICITRQERSDHGLPKLKVQCFLNFFQQLLGKFTFIQNISTDP